MRTLLARQTAAAAFAGQGDEVRLPLSATAAALVALVSLHLTIGQWQWVTPLLGVALLASQFTAARLPARPPLTTYLIRFLLIGIIYFANMEEPNSNSLSMGPLTARNMIGEFWAAEMMVQAWVTHRTRAARILPVVFLAGMTFISACNTFETDYIRYLAPVFVLLVAISLRTYRARRGAATHPSTERRAQRQRFVLLALALTLGFGANALVGRYHSELMDLGGNLLRESRWRPEGSGMASQPALGETFGLRGSSERVFRLEILSPGNADISHLRGLSFDEYADGRWYPRINRRQFTRLSPAEFAPDSAKQPKRGAATTARITRLQRYGRMLFFPLETAALIMDEASASGLEWAQGSGGPVITQTRELAFYDFVVAETAFYPGIAAGRPPTPEQKARYLVVPESFAPEARELAKQVAGNLPSPEMKAEAVAAYLISNHHYSLTVKPGKGDPVSRFLLQKKDAHCEYFASAAALMLRCVGVPTRYVTGYYAHEEDGENRLIVRQRDAHAWAEAWIDGKGWMVVEATPGDGMPGGDRAEGVPLWQRIKDRVQDAIQAARDSLSNLTPNQLAALMAGVPALLLFAPVARAYWRRRQRLRAEAASAFAYAAANDARIVALGSRFETLFARAAGEPFPDSRTWQEQIAFLTNRVPVPADTPPSATVVSDEFLLLARQFVLVYDRLRFGAASGEAGEADDNLDRDTAVLEQLLHAMERERSTQAERPRQKSAADMSAPVP